MTGKEAINRLLVEQLWTKNKKTEEAINIAIGAIRKNEALEGYIANIETNLEETGKEADKLRENLESAILIGDLVRSTEENTEHYGETGRVIGQSENTIEVQGDGWNDKLWKCYVERVDELPGRAAGLMTGNKYQVQAARTINKNLNEFEKTYHALHGMAGEVGEIHSLYQKSYQGHAIEEEHLKKEVGDLLWFIAEYCTVMNWKLEDVMKLNIEKLKARYPKGFEVEKSLNRQEGDI